MESTGGWNKQKILAKPKEYHAVAAIDKCVSVTLNIKDHMLENIYKMVFE
jgi:hypothetical protein